MREVCRCGAVGSVTPALECLAEVAGGDGGGVAIDLLGRGVEPRLVLGLGQERLVQVAGGGGGAPARPRPPPAHRSSGTLPTNEIGHIPWMSGSPHGVFGCVHPLGVSMKWLASLGGPAGDCPLTTATNKAAART